MGDTAMLREVNRENAGMALAKDARFWEAQTWNTPKANDAEKRGNVAVRSNAPELVAQAGHWCTPNASPLSSSTTLQCSGDGRELPNKLGWQISQWMTPNVPNGGRSVSEELVASKGTPPEGDKRTVGLESQTKFWATPTSSENSNRGGKMAPSHGVSHGIVLAGQAGAWPTPGAMQYGGTAEQHLARKAEMDGGSRKTVTELNAYVGAWPTPATRDHKGANSAEHALVTGGGQEAHGPTEQLCGLFAPGPSDPRWGPIIAAEPWRAPAISKETESVLCRVADGMVSQLDFGDRAARLRACGNGVVPGQAAYALVQLVGRASK